MQIFPQLNDWLSHLETAHPVGIDMGLHRISQVRNALQLKFTCPVFTVGGTNGKGSTCAMLEAILHAAGYKVACHTSPHLLSFNERARMQCEFATDAQLLPHFAAVERARCSFPEPISLTYFEFTTLAILHWFASCELEAVILEVGMGGRLDAVNCIDADCAIVTSIDIDHQAYLGNNREAIGFEKAGIFRTGKVAVCADPIPPHSLVQHAEALGTDFWQMGRDYNFNGDKQQWNWAGRGRRIHSLGYPALRGANQLLNASAVLAALQAMRDVLPVSLQDIRNGLAYVELPGRFQVLPGRPLVVLDVAHNPHAAATLAQNLDNMGFHPYTYAVFGAMRDKDLAGVIQPLLDKVDYWYVTDLPSPRAARAVELAQVLRDAGYQDGADRDLKTFTSPAEAFAAAHEKAGENDRITVFGSFFTVAGVMAWRKAQAH